MPNRYLALAGTPVNYSSYYYVNFYLAGLEWHIGCSESFKMHMSTGTWSPHVCVSHAAFCVASRIVPGGLLTAPKSQLKLATTSGTSGLHML